MTRSDVGHRQSLLFNALTLIRLFVSHPIATAAVGTMILLSFAGAVWQASALPRITVLAVLSVILMLIAAKLAFAVAAYRLTHGARFPGSFVVSAMYVTLLFVTGAGFALSEIAHADLERIIRILGGVFVITFPFILIVFRAGDFIYRAVPGRKRG